MKKMSYEYLIIATNALYQNLDKTAVSLCSLKDSISKMSTLLIREYEEKYKTNAKKNLKD